MQPFSIRIDDAARQPGVTQSTWRLRPVGAVPGAQPECPYQVRNEFYRDDNIKNKKTKSVSGGFRSAR